MERLNQPHHYNQGGKMKPNTTHKRISIWSVTTVLCFIFMVAMPAYAWDPSGNWGIEERPDIDLRVACQGDTCNVAFQSARSKGKGSGYVLNDKMIIAYYEYSSNTFYFLTLTKNGESRMSGHNYEFNCKSVAEDKWVRK